MPVSCKVHINQVIISSANLGHRSDIWCIIECITVQCKVTQLWAMYCHTVSQQLVQNWRERRAPKDTASESLYCFKPSVSHMSPLIWISSDDFLFPAKKMQILTRKSWYFLVERDCHSLRSKPTLFLYLPFSVHSVRHMSNAYFIYRIYCIHVYWFIFVFVFPHLSQNN